MRTNLIQKKDMGFNLFSFLKNPKEPYDIVVNTYENSTEECADKIIPLLDNSENFKAFKNINLQKEKLRPFRREICQDKLEELF